MDFRGACQLDLLSSQGTSAIVLLTSQILIYLLDFEERCCHSYGIHATLKTGRYCLISYVEARKGLDYSGCIT